MSITRTSDYELAVSKLETLADDLSGRGFVTTLVTGGGYPCVTVSNKSAAPLYETIYAAPASDSSWWLWWSWAERISPVGETDAAVTKIAHVLTAP